MDNSFGLRTKKVAVLGAGNVGLIFLRNMVKKGNRVTCYEQRSKVGGMWNFEAKQPELG